MFIFWLGGLGEKGDAEAPTATARGAGHRRRQRPGHA